MMKTRLSPKIKQSLSPEVLKKDFGTFKTVANQTVSSPDSFVEANSPGLLLRGGRYNPQSSVVGSSPKNFDRQKSSERLNNKIDQIKHQKDSSAKKTKIQFQSPEGKK